MGEHGVLKVRDGVKVGLDVVPRKLETTCEWRVAKASERWGRERENDWTMIRYVDPEVTVVNGKGDGSDLGRTLREDMIYPTGPSGAVPGKVGDPVAKLVWAQAQGGGWIPPAGGKRPILEALAVRPGRFVGGNIPGAVEVTRKDR